jgi:hypothetical protein
MVTISRRLGTLLLIASGTVAACTPAPNGQQTQQPAAAVGATPLDTARMFRQLGVLAHDSMEGRRTATPGGERARRFLVAQLRDIGLQQFGNSYEHPFTFTPRNATEQLQGVNVVGWVRGTRQPERYIVVTAHFDHLGVRDGQIYNGADDNASGSAALLELARHFQAQPAEHSIIFALLDAEEMGLQGARAFVANPPVPAGTLVFNVNMDMIGRNDRDELYAVGTYHYPWTLPIVERVAADAPVRLLTGHDRPDLPPGDDWTQSSDHGPFHNAGIPFLYFGVEDHPDYHQPTDTVQGIQPSFYGRAAETVRRTLRALDTEDLAARRMSGGRTGS